MKSMGKRMVCLLMALLLTMVQPVWAGALEGGYVTVVNEAVVSEDSQFYPAAFDSYESTAAGRECLYNTLNARQKAVYNAMKNITWSRLISSSGNMVQVNVSGINGASFTGYASGGRFVPTGASASAYNNMESDVFAAYMALRYDRPDLLWMDGAYRTNYRFQGSNSSGRYRITNFYIGFVLDYGSQTESMRSRMMAEARNIASTANREKDMYSKVMKVHDMLAQRGSYNFAALDSGSASALVKRLAHSAYSGMFYDEYNPVCEGYAKAFKIVLNLMDIPCVLVVSDTHMWNNVKMDDGLWYNVDLTWDDSGDSIKYAYFLVGSQTRIGSGTFASSHIEYDPINSTTVISSAKYPRKNTVKYEYLGQNYPPLRFADVPRDDYGYQHIEKVAGLGYFSGDNTGRFNPGKNITRAEFASVIAKAMGVNTDFYKGLYSFPDVGAGQWYSGVVYWAKASGVMSGSGGKFRPDAPITRQEMCTVMKNALSLPSYSATPFADHYRIASWAVDGVYACRALGLVNGFTDGSFKPDNNTSRRDAAIVLSKYATSIGK